MHISILALFALLPSLALNCLASPTHTDGCPAGSEYCSRALELRAPPSRDAAPTPTSPPLTNAQRLARGLPIKPPHRRATIGPRSAFPRASSVPRTNYRGIIAVTNTANGQILGYISTTSLGHAQYGYESSAANALIVSFDTDADAIVASAVRMTSENSDIPGFTLVSLVQGREDTSVDFAPGSLNYAYIAGMAEPGSASNSVPVTSPANSYTAATGSTRAAISNVWEFNRRTLALTLQWVNSDGSKPTTDSFAQGPALYVGGDQAAFTQRFPATVTGISFILVPL